MPSPTFQHPLPQACGTLGGSGASVPHHSTPQQTQQGNHGNQRGGKYSYPQDRQLGAGMSNTESSSAIQQAYQEQSQFTQYQNVIPSQPVPPGSQGLQPPCVSADGAQLHRPTRYGGPQSPYVQPYNPSADQVQSGHPAECYGNPQEPYVEQAQQAPQYDHVQSQYPSSDGYNNSRVPANSAPSGYPAEGYNHPQGMHMQQAPPQRNLVMDNARAGTYNDPRGYSDQQQHLQYQRQLERNQQQPLGQYQQLPNQQHHQYDQGQPAINQQQPQYQPMQLAPNQQHVQSQFPVESRGSGGQPGGYYEQHPQVASQATADVSLRADESKHQRSNSAPICFEMQPALQQRTNLKLMDNARAGTCDDPRGRSDQQQHLQYQGQFEPNQQHHKYQGQLALNQQQSQFPVESRGSGGQPGGYYEQQHPQVASQVAADVRADESKHQRSNSAPICLDVQQALQQRTNLLMDNARAGTYNNSRGYFDQHLLGDHMREQRYSGEGYNYPPLSAYPAEGYDHSKGMHEQQPSGQQNTPFNNHMGYSDPRQHPQFQAQRAPNQQQLQYQPQQPAPNRQQPPYPGRPALNQQQQYQAPNHQQQPQYQVGENYDQQQAWMASQAQQNMVYPRQDSDPSQQHASGNPQPRPRKVAPKQYYSNVDPHQREVVHQNLDEQTFANPHDSNMPSHHNHPVAAPRNLPSPHERVQQSDSNPQAAGDYNSSPSMSVPPPTVENPHDKSSDSIVVSKKALMENIEREIAQVAADVWAEVSGESVRQKTEMQAPVDPNLVCPLCLRQFRIGEIQKFKKHVENCDGVQKK